MGFGHTAWAAAKGVARCRRGTGCTRLVLDELSAAGVLDWSRASIDGGVGARQKGVELTGPNPTDRGKPGSKYHLLCDANGLLECHVLPSPANTHEACCSSRCWTPTPLSGVSAVAQGGHGAGLRSCTPPRAMTTSGAAPTCTAVASPFGSLAAGSRTRPSSAGIAGSLSAPSHGCCASSASACVMTAPNGPSGQATAHPGHHPDQLPAPYESQRVTRPGLNCQNKPCVCHLLHYSHSSGCSARGDVSAFSAAVQAACRAEHGEQLVSAATQACSPGSTAPGAVGSLTPPAWKGHGLLSPRPRSAQDRVVPP